MKKRVTRFTEIVKQYTLVPLVLGDYGEPNRELRDLIRFLAKKKSLKLYAENPRYDRPESAFPTVLWDFKKRIATTHSRNLCAKIRTGRYFVEGYYRKPKSQFRFDEVQAEREMIQ